MNSLPFLVIIFSLIVGFLGLPSNIQAEVVNTNGNLVNDKANTDKVEIADAKTSLAVTNVPSSTVIPENITKINVEIVNHEPELLSANNMTTMTSMQETEMSTKHSTHTTASMAGSAPDVTTAMNTTAITTIPPSTSTATTTTTTTTTTSTTTTSDTPANQNTTTTVIPTTTHEPPTTTTTAQPTTTTLQPTTSAPTPAPSPVPCHRFDGASFTGGIVLTLGVLAISLIAYKFKPTSDGNYQIV